MTTGWDFLILALLTSPFWAPYLALILGILVSPFMRERESDAKMSDDKTE